MTHFDPAPTRLDEVLAPTWLDSMLAFRWPGTRVREVTIVEVLATQATKVRLALQLDGGDPDVPTRICIKGVLTDTGAPPSASIVETLFYRDLAGKLPVRVPPCIYARLDAGGSRGVVVMHDVIAAGGRFCSALEAFTPAEALEGLDQLARLHVSAWQDTSVYALDWAPSFLDQITARPIVPLNMLQELLDGPRGEPLPTKARDAARLQQAIEQLAKQVRGGPRCLVHGDAHAGNVYRQANGELGLVDWQILQKGDWAQDVAYHLAAVLLPEDRRMHERALLDEYRARLKLLGGPDLDANTAWRQYRAALVYGLYLWAITRKVEPAITHEFVRRLGLAVDDLQSFELLAV